MIFPNYWQLVQSLIGKNMVYHLHNSLSVSLINKNKSERKILNISGPRIDPCGTQTRIICHKL